MPLDNQRVGRVRCSRKSREDIQGTCLPRLMSWYHQRIVSRESVKSKARATPRIIQWSRRTDVPLHGWHRYIYSNDFRAAALKEHVSKHKMRLITESLTLPLSDHPHIPQRRGSHQPSRESSANAVSPTSSGVPTV
jgi:hypothetical protein